MRTTMKIFAGTAGIAAVAASAPAAAQYYGNPYGYQSNRYVQAYGYGYNGAASDMAVQQCQAAVQSRLNVRGTSGILGAIFGMVTVAIDDAG